ncbi:hydroxylamine reductase [Fontivita pretiosa]|uniref:hydroxylamine reductase n=1 Tax=Fontivita pretiosa TaxID=2989684 RepID=UPI003D17CB03
MRCNQCEQAMPYGCSGPVGNCGKDQDVQSLHEIILYGLKGMAAYAHHARRLGKTDESVSAFIEQALFSTMTNVNFDLPSLIEIAMELGQKNLRVMQMLDEGHIERFGVPSPATVREGTQAGRGILVTGHDLLDLADLLEQVRGTDLKVYTHGEMLPAHMYPRLREHPNLAGHYGGAWHEQREQFAQFSGPILATSNCVLIPSEQYRDRLFTTRMTAVPGATRLTGHDFSPVIHKALQCPPMRQRIDRTSTIGFHRCVLLEMAPTIVEAIRAGKISRFYVIGGCDGARPGRNVFADYARATPPDSFILTLGCGKFRIRNHDYGTLLGLPRLLDMGQCNDAYGAISVALALARALGCQVNELPLTLAISWFEQKAVAVLLTLLSLGVRGIVLGPTPPQFITPNVWSLLKDRFDLKLTGNGNGRVRLAAMAPAGA